MLFEIHLDVSVFISFKNNLLTSLPKMAMKNFLIIFFKLRQKKKLQLFHPYYIFHLISLSIRPGRSYLIYKKARIIKILMQILIFSNVSQVSKFCLEKKSTNLLFYSHTVKCIVKTLKLIF
jgi:hypothetical protein